MHAVSPVGHASSWGTLSSFRGGPLQVEVGTFLKGGRQWDTKMLVNGDGDGDGLETLCSAVNASGCLISLFGGRKGRDGTTPGAVGSCVPKLRC